MNEIKNVTNTTTPEVAPQISSGVEERDQVTAFVDDQAVIPEHVPGETILSDLDTLQYTDNMRHTIISFLERPQLISCFSWKGASNDMHGQNILCLQDPNNPSSLIMNPLVPSQVMTKMFIEKLQGFTAFRATAVFRLQINSQNFQAGRLIFGALPMPTLLAERADFIVKTPCSALSVNHVQMDINKQTEVLLRVPFISPFNSYDLINQQYDWASLFCIVYGPLNVVGDDNILQCDLYCHFEDIELGCPTTAECTIKPCVAPTRVVYWGETPQSQAGRFIVDMVEKKRQEAIKNQLMNKRKQKENDRQRKNQYMIKYNILPQSQSGKVRTKGLLVSAGWTDQSDGTICADLVDKYWVDIWSAGETTQKVLVSFQKSTRIDTLPGVDNKLLFSGPYDFKDTIKFSNNQTILIWQVFALDEFIPNDTVCNDPNCASNISVNITPIISDCGHDTPDAVVPETPPPNNTPELFQSQPWNIWNDQGMGPPHSQAGRFDYYRPPRHQSYWQDYRPMRRFRAPPKEASTQKVKKAREEESDGVFAKKVKSFAKSVGNVATSVGDAVANLGNWLGWSKPQLSHSGGTVVIRPSEYFANTNGIDHSHVLSLDLLNNVDSYPCLAGSDLDELSLDYVKRIPQFIGAFQYNNKNVISPSNSGIGTDYLWSCFVLPNYINPACFQIQYTGQFGEDTASVKNILKVENPTSLGYICAPFTYWTGSLVYTFRFVKTNYNSGRIEISFHPFFYSKDYGGHNIPAPDNQRFQYAYKVVVDLRDNSEVSLTVPYISPQQWKSLGYYNQRWFTNPCKDPTDWGAIELDEMARCSTGLLWVRALTPLHTQSAVAPTSILCLVECRAGDDFALQCPTTNRYIPLTTTPSSQAGKVYATPGTEDTRTRALEGFVPPSITGDEKDINREDTQMFCAGEYFENFRQFIKRNMFVRSIYQTNSYNGMALFPNEFIIPPRIKLNIYKYGSDYFQIFVLPNWPSPMSYISALYCFYRGGVRFKIVTTDRSGSLLPGLLSARLISSPYVGVPQELTPGTTEFNDIQTYSSPVHFEQQDKNIGEFQIPYYSPTLQSVPWSLRGGYLYDNPLPFVKVTNSLVSSSVSRATAQYHIATSASDDFDLGYFLGAPLCLKTSLWQQGGNYTAGKSYPLFSQSNPYDTIFDADPCYFTPPFANGIVPTGSGEMVKISTTNLNLSLANVTISNPNLNVTSDPSKIFITGCSP